MLELRPACENCNAALPPDSTDAMICTFECTACPIPDLPGVVESSVAWSDFDGDGRLDFLSTGTTNGNLSGATSQLRRNSGNGFTNVPVPGLIGTSFGSAAWATNGMLRLPQMGAARNNSTTFHNLTPGQTYYWSVQAVDTSFAGSPFAAEQQFGTSPLVLNAVRYDNGVFEFGFSSTPGATFTALGATNPSLPLNNWTVLGAAEEVSPGRFRFIDPQAPNNPQRFYRVSAP